MLTLLAALLLTGPLPARAEDSPAASAPARDPADADGDGTVSGKERRQHRRAERRARRGQLGSNGELLTDEEADAAEAAESSARGAAASSKAAGAAAALKNMLPSGDAGSLPGGGTPAPDGQPTIGGRTSAVGTSASAGGSKSTPAGDAKNRTGDPGKPIAPSDFVLAARSGYEPAFAAAGLKLGPDGRSVVRLDGGPATAEDYARLRSEIASMPAALGRRPDFFNAVSPARYADLKRGYQEKPAGDTVYKHVGTTAEDRDFIHTASCDKLSGDCNEHVVTASYKKGDFVAPEDLDSMWDALQKELDGSAEAGGLPSLAATRSGISRAAAVDAARALSEGGMDEEDAIRSATAEGPPPRPTAVSEAVASLKRLWKTAASPVVEHRAGGAAGQSSAPPLALGALAFAALGAGALFMRRKG
ncbi:MAG: hypothetical protein Q8T11_07810 [Elusimicrobiota bacterium]|nr:hypothetical protein [Elusimicrobiota bacterium]